MNQYTYGTATRIKSYNNNVDQNRFKFLFIFFDDAQKLISVNYTQTSKKKWNPIQHEVIRILDKF